MATDKTRGPVETKLFDLLNKQTDVTMEEVQALLTDLLDCAREDMYIHKTFTGTMTPSQSGGRLPW